MLSQKLISLQILVLPPTRTKNSSAPCPPFPIFKMSDHLPGSLRAGSEVRCRKGLQELWPLCASKQAVQGRVPVPWAAPRTKDLCWRPCPAFRASTPNGVLLPAATGTQLPPQPCPPPDGRPHFRLLRNNAPPPWGVRPTTFLGLIMEP